MTLNKNQLIYLWIGLGLFVAAFMWDAYFSKDNNSERYKNIIEKYLHKAEYEVNQLLEDKTFINNLQKIDDEAVSTYKLDLAQKLRERGINFTLFREKELVLWTQNDVLPLGINLTDTTTSKTVAVMSKLNDSQYELRYRNYRDDANQRITAAVLIPLKKMYPTFEGEYLKNHFPASSILPSNLDLSENKQKNNITTLEGKILCYISNDGSDIDLMHDWGMVILLCLGFLMLGLVGDGIAKQLLSQYPSPAVGIIFFVSIFIMLRLCILWIQDSDLLAFLNEGLGTFNGATFVKSLPAFFIMTMFLFWVSTFINSKFKLPDFSGQPLPIKWTLAASFYCIIVLLMIMSVGVYFDLVTSSKNLLNFESLSEFDTKSIFTLTVSGIMLLSVFLLTHRCIDSINKLNITKVNHFFAVDVAVSLGVVLFKNYEIHLPIGVFIFFIFLYIIIFHQFISYQKPGLIWLVQWVVVFSVIQTFFISRFNIQKDDKTIRDYAATLAKERDTVAERRISAFTLNVAHDPLIQTLSTFPFRIDTDPASISNRINNHFQNDEYLSNQYSVRFFSHYQNGVALIPGDSLNLNSFVKQFDKGIAIDKATPNVRFWTDKKGSFAYLSLIKVQVQNNSIYIGAEFRRDDKLSSRVFTELLVDKHYKALRLLNEFDYAIYKNYTIKEQNPVGTYPLYITKEKLPQPGMFKDTMIGSHKEITHQNTEGVVVKIGYEYTISSQVLTLWVFSVIMLSTLLILFSLINYFFNFLPDIVNFNLGFSLSTSLQYRILFPSIAFVLLSFFAIFWFTTRYYKVIDEKYYTADMENKSNAIISNIANELSSLRKYETDNTLDSVKYLLGRYAQSHQTAIHYYDTNGALYATTEENIFDKGILAERMSSKALLELSSGKEKVYKSEEKIGDFNYKTAYYGIQDSIGASLGFLELPFYSRDRKSRIGITDIWTYNASIMTLLFILGICIIYIQTTRILQPIREIANYLRRLTLNKKSKNELITIWDNKEDEIGILIDAYNNKVAQLDETFLKLTEAEREGAWRDMAQQVAHEVRNPLTPMKLVVQHLEMVRRRNPENLKDYLEKSNKMLLDQIDSLERIVSEFASFAKIPQKANNEMFVLNDLVQSVGDFFGQHNTEGKNINFIVNVPDEERYHVYADRQLLTGALNNLAKNAIQAIPEEHEGRIIMSLYKNNNKAIIRISDNGMGIPKEIQEKIFTPYFTTKQYGTGLGLLITKNILNAVNGNISFDSRENEGTDFFIELEIQEIVRNSIGEGNSIIDTQVK